MAVVFWIYKMDVMTWSVIDKAGIGYVSPPASGNEKLLHSPRFAAQVLATLALNESAHRLRGNCADIGPRFRVGGERLLRLLTRQS